MREATDGALECAILIGIQGSGKTTFYNERLAATHVHVSKDEFPDVRDRNAHQMRLVAEALSRGRSVVVDNTNPTPADRAPLVEASRVHGARVVAYYFEPAIRESIRRNEGRAGRRRVPVVAVYATAKKLVQPSPLEGFDSLFRVRIVADRTFEITEL